MIKLLCTFALLFWLGSVKLPAQSKGDFFIGYGFEFPSGGYLALRYYPVDKIGFEIYTSAFWYIFNWGARANIHVQQALPHTFISIGYSHITAYNPDAVHDTGSGDFYFLQRTMQGVDLGIGREIEYDFKHFSFQIGPTYVLNIEDGFVNKPQDFENVQTSPMFSYFFVATHLAHLPEKDPEPVRYFGH